MAPKAKAPKTAAKATQQTASPTGLQLSAAQWQAYNAAYTSAASAGYRNLAIQSAAASLRRYRLGAAYSLAKKVAVTHAAARASAIAQFAAQQTYRQSRLAYQNAALRQRIYANLQRHVRQTSRLQYAYKGEAAYLHTAVMRTLTTAQAVNVETARFNAAVSTAKKAIASTLAAGASSAPASPGVAAVRATAQAAGLAAARAAPAGRTAPRPDLPEPVLREPFGDPDGYDCVAAAIATHLDWHTAYRMTPDDYAFFVTLLGEAPTIQDALEVTQVITQYESWQGPRLASYAQAEPSSGRAPNGSRLVAGYDTPLGAHASLLLSDLLVFSWGELMLLEDVITPGAGIDEAWELQWERV